MKKSEIWEGVILLLAVLLLLPIWLAQADKVQFPPTISTLLNFLMYSLVIVLGVIFVRRLRRIIRALRENKNRPGTF